ncbi:hypothetical protein WMI54_14260 [Staphylococcus aureus]
MYTLSSSNKRGVESLAKFVEQRLRPYDYEFYDAVELIGLVNDLCHELNHLEISQATEQRPIDVFNYEKKNIQILLMPSY